MDIVVINVYKHDDTFFKTPSLCEFVVEETEGWRDVVEATIAKQFTPRSKYFLSYEYKKAAKLLTLEASA